MSLAETEKDRLTVLEEKEGVMSGLNPGEREELFNLHEKKWEDIDPYELIVEEELVLFRVNRKDPYAPCGFDFKLKAEFRGLEFIYIGNYDNETIRITPRELDEVVYSCEPDGHLGNARKIEEYLQDNLNSNIHLE